MIHFFKKPISHLALPGKFTYPFHYTPHPLCVLAAEEVKSYVASRTAWQEELASGKMFGVLIVQEQSIQTASPTTDKMENRTDAARIGYLAAFSGNLAGTNLHTYFAPPVYDLLQPDGFFKLEEEEISAINHRIYLLENNSEYLRAKTEWKEETERFGTLLKEGKIKLKMAKETRELRRRSTPALSESEQAALIRESQFQKAELKRMEIEGLKKLKVMETVVTDFESETERLRNERKERSAALQRKLFEQFQMLNARGEVKDLYTIFEETVGKVPPAGAGECALPKLLQYAYLHQLKPLAMAEFWWGTSPKNEIRHHGYYYPSCKGKCGPILRHMLQGLAVDENPVLHTAHQDKELEKVYEDEWLVVINKPAGMLSVPGKAEEEDSVYHRLKKMYPHATGPLIVHRLDMATSGLLVAAKTKEVHQPLQAQFEERTVEKRYVAILDGQPQRLVTDREKVPVLSGRIELPLCPDPLDRPRQMVSQKYGKPAITTYRIIRESGGHTRISLSPLTGRTHQLRVHMAHPDGLGCPILGDGLYGKRADRLYLHAEYLAFSHPISGDRICVQKEADF